MLLAAVPVGVEPPPRGDVVAMDMGVEIGDVDDAVDVDEVEEVEAECGRIGGRCPGTRKAVLVGESKPWTAAAAAVAGGEEADEEEDVEEEDVEEEEEEEEEEEDEEEEGLGEPATRAAAPALSISLPPAFPPTATQLLLLLVFGDGLFDPPVNAAS